LEGLSSFAVVGDAQCASRSPHGEVHDLGVLMCKNNHEMNMCFLVCAYSTAEAWKNIDYLTQVVSNPWGNYKMEIEFLVVVSLYLWKMLFEILGCRCSRTFFRGLGEGSSRRGALAGQRGRCGSKVP